MAARARVGKSVRWVPKKWLPAYDMIVALHIQNWTNKRIGEHFGYTAQQVCNIIGTPQAQALISIARERIRQTLGEDIVDRMAKLEDAALRNVEHVLTDEALRIKNPLAVADRSIAFLKGVGKLDKGEERDKVIERTMVIPSELVQKMVDGMSKANEAMMKFGNTEVKKLKP